MKIYGIYTMAFIYNKCTHGDWLLHHGQCELINRVTRFQKNFLDFSTMKLLLADSSLNKFIMPKDGYFPVFNEELTHKLEKHFQHNIYGVTVKKVVNHNFWNAHYNEDHTGDSMDFFTSTPGINIDYKCFELRYPRIWPIAKNAGITEEINIRAKELKTNYCVPFHSSFFAEYPVIDAGDMLVREDIFELIYPYIDSKYYVITELDANTFDKSLL